MITSKHDIGPNIGRTYTVKEICQETKSIMWCGHCRQWKIITESGIICPKHGRIMSVRRWLRDKGMSISERDFRHAWKGHINDYQPSAADEESVK